MKIKKMKENVNSLYKENEENYIYKENYDRKSILLRKLIRIMTDKSESKK